MQYIEILPLTKTGSEDQTFTYASEEEIQTGSLVSIPLRNRLVRGIVTKVVKKPTFPTKKINKIQSLEPVLTETQLKLAQKISEYYLAPLGDVISTILSFDFGKKRRNVPGTERSSKNLEQPLKLTEDQEKALNTIKNGKKDSKYLLFGVTGSGKTEIYLQLCQEALNKNQGAIVLVPEIALTPQTVSRFKKRFGEKVAVWHSGMKETEKFFTWQKIKTGEKQIVVGARSAIFTPVKNLAYIILDEEHEGSYKQDQTPRYEAGKVGEWLGKLTGAKVVYGSATPRIETFYKTKNTDYKLCSLNKRIVQGSMPPVKIIDLTDEFKKGNKSIFSEALIAAMNRVLAEKKQVLLFVNRRGASTFVVCRDCGYVSECVNCGLPLTYHPSEGEILKCHHCDFRTQVPVKCPICSSLAIRYFGLGTQRCELEAIKLFKNAKIARMDRDTTKKRGSHEAIYEDFKDQNFDILIGTQIIAKGWDLPNVSLVGVISADTTLNLPDFRAAERTFSLLTQVAGRTGRGFHPGEVIIQTYAPENYAVLAAKGHSFEEFYEKEITLREKYSYPPFSNLIKLTYSSSLNEKTEKEASALAEILKTKLPQVELVGPSSAFIPRINNKYRWQIILKVINRGSEEEKEQKIIEILEILKKELKNGWVVDINPDNLL